MLWFLSFLLKLSNTSNRQNPKKYADIIIQYNVKNNNSYCILTLSDHRGKG